MPQTDNEKKTESSGRSIVEMLGVLAVIGVLSIGGITGYRYGMNRHQANQVLHEMNMASTQLSIQLQQGAKNGVKLALDEPFNSGVLQSAPFGFAYVCGDVGSATKNCAEEETRYQLAVTNVPYGVCQQLTENISNLQYYDDMFVNGSWDGDCQNDSGNEIAVLFNVSETASIAASGAAYYYTTYTQYTTDTEKKGACGENCKESEGKFCNAYSSVCTANKSYDGGCLTAANYAKQGAQSGLVASNISINSWWSAESFCKALGKRLVSLESLGCNKAIGACNTERVAQMKADFKNDYHFGWTSSFDGTENACNAYSIRLGTGDVNSVGRIYAYSEALCEDEAPSCTTAADCGVGQACVNGDCSDSCTADSQCRSDEHCEGGKCVSNCTADSQCGNSVYDHCITQSGATQWQCKKCTSSSPYFNGITCTTCPTTTPKWNEETGECEACPSDAVWNESSGKCEMPGKENQPCKAGLKCDDGLYCKTSSSGCDIEASTGVCKKATVAAEGIVNTKTMYVSSDSMNWWSTERFCEALGKKRVSRDSLGCSGYTTGTTSGRCFSDDDHVSGTGSGDSSTGIKKELYELYQKAKSSGAWLDDDYGGSCYAYHTYLNNGLVITTTRDINFQALCEDDVPLCQTAADCGVGQACVEGICSESCTADSQCRSDEHCEGGKCVSNCTSSNECEDLGCNTKNGRCESCTNSDSLCNGTNKVCNEDNGQCVACMSNGDCTTAAAPVCNETTYTCAKCTTNPQCGDSVYDHCITASGSTQGQCAKCTAENPYFNGSTCTTCPTTTPQWNETEGKCEGCPTGTIQYAGDCYEGCRTNDDCVGKVSGKPYCYMYYGNNCTSEFSGGPSKSSFSGVCHNAEDDVGAIGIVNGNETVVSSNTMTWWSAGRFCEALGKHRVTRTDIGCSGWTGSYRCMSNSNYPGGSDTSSIVMEINELVKNSSVFLWLEDNYSETSSCAACDFYTKKGSVSFMDKSLGSRKAWCE